MRFQYVGLGGLLVGLAYTSPVCQTKRTDLTTGSSDIEVATGQNDLIQRNAAFNTIMSLNASSTCSKEKLRVRKEWSTISRDEKLAYIEAVQCVQANTARIPSSLVAGAKSRFDDFVATHINQTQTIHYTGTFLAWHRYFTWVFEETLRNECGYTGTQPYWDWTLSAKTGLAAYPLFDGSETSISGDGAYEGSREDIVLGGNGLPDVYLPTGTGGGCVLSGPFVNMTVNLGPNQLNLPGGGLGALNDTFAWNPRCLKRDLTDYINQRFSNASALAINILNYDNVYNFQMIMQGVPGNPSGDMGIHVGGHYSIGGDPARDVAVSPGDPAFYFHHSMIDRVWWMWQNLDRETRMDQIMGTGTFFNNPPSANTTLATEVNLGYVTEQAYQMKDLMDSTKGPFCYTYE